MENSFEVYNSYYSIADAKSIIDVLIDNNIEYQTEQNYESPLGSFYAGDSANPKYVLKIKQKDFVKLDALFQQKSNSNIEGSSNDIEHYLYEYDNDELKQILLESDKWHPQDVLLANEILGERGINYNKAEIDKIKQKRIEDLSRTKKGKSLLIIAGYLLSVLGVFLPFSLFFMLLSPVIGANYYFLKKTLPNGSKIFVYDEITRKKGAYLIAFGSSMLVLLVFFPQLLYDIYCFFI